MQAQTYQQINFQTIDSICQEKNIDLNSVRKLCKKNLDHRKIDLMTFDDVDDFCHLPTIRFLFEVKELKISDEQINNISFYEQPDVIQYLHINGLAKFNLEHLYNAISWDNPASCNLLILIVNPSLSDLKNLLEDVKSFKSKKCRVIIEDTIKMQKLLNKRQ